MIDFENTVIVSRHKGAIEFIATTIAQGNGWVWDIAPNNFIRFVEIIDGVRKDKGIISVITDDATKADVIDRVVYGNLPLALAVLTKEIRAVEFEGKAPRGQEYTCADMVAAGAYITSYVILTAFEYETLIR